MSVFRRPGDPESRKARVEERIRVALEGLRPLLRPEPAGLELVEFDERTGVALMRVEGDCPDCNMKVSMLLQGIEAHLRMRVRELATTTTGKVRLTLALSAGDDATLAREVRQAVAAVDGVTDVHVEITDAGAPRAKAAAAPAVEQPPVATPGRTAGIGRAL